VCLDTTLASQILHRSPRLHLLQYRNDLRLAVLALAHPLSPFVRPKSYSISDGLRGSRQLAPEDFTGVLAPLREPSFFRQVFVDHGTVAWPGEIDLPPDAMYRQIGGERR
jgi:Protein of unknown function (DUF2442)